MHPITADVMSTHPTIQAKSSGRPNTSGWTRFTNGMPPSIPTAGNSTSQRYRRADRGRADLAPDTVAAALIDRSPCPTTPSPRPRRYACHGRAPVRRCRIVRGGADARSLARRCVHPHHHERLFVDVESFVVARMHGPSLV